MDVCLNFDVYVLKKHPVSAVCSTPSCQGIIAKVVIVNYTNAWYFLSCQTCPNQSITETFFLYCPTSELKKWSELFITYFAIAT